MLSTFTFAILLACSFVASEVHVQDESPQVKLTDEAIVSGVIKSSRSGRSYAAFSGIQYATIPERFAEPQLVTKPSWTGVSEFSTPGPMCPQVFFSHDHELYDDEDCLNLNVAVPLNSSEKSLKNVMLWIHGGTFSFGGGYGYEETYFMDEDVVVVTINYRLGVFGFLSTGDEVVPGNNGMKDMIAALKWVQQNIAKFGGDPKKVTIFGESAGGGAVHYLMISPAAQGLFHRAISQSGSAYSGWAFQPNPKDNAITLATYLNCSDVSTSETILNCLRGVSKDELNLAQFSYETVWPSGMPPFVFVPTAEPEVGATSSHTPFITKSPVSLIRDGQLPPVQVPWLVGVNEDEGAAMSNSVVLTDTELLRELDSNWSKHALSIIMATGYFSDKQQQKEEVAKKLRKFYFGDKEISLETAKEYIDFYSDGLITNGVYKAVRDAVAMDARKEPIFVYQYAYPGPLSLCSLFGQVREEEKKKVSHADELQHLWVLGESVMPGYKHLKQKRSPEDLEFSKNLVQLWVSFAKHGEPKHSWGTSSSKDWKALSKSDLSNGLKWYRIDSNPTTLDQDPYKERMEFWENVIWPIILDGQSDADSKGNSKTEL